MVLAHLIIAKERFSAMMMILMIFKGLVELLNSFGFSLLKN